MNYKYSFLLSFLIGLYAIGSWIDMNGLWVELPLLVQTLPEGWKLPTYVVAIIQFANIAPLLYMGIHHWGKFKNLERITIYSILLVGCTCCALLSAFWNHTLCVYIFGKWQQSSVIFFILVWFLSMVDTTSSMTFLPYLVNYPKNYITALYVGEGLSGLVPGIIGLIQGVGGESYCVNITKVINETNTTTSILFIPPPRFSVSGFFLCLCVILAICTTSFSLVDNLKYFQIFKVQIKNTNNNELTRINQESIEFSTNSIDQSEKQPQRGKSQCILYILLIAYINFFTNGLLPSIQNYSLMPYSVKLYHLVVTGTQILNPLACLLTIRQWNVNHKIIIFITTLGSFGTAYIIFLACKSPTAVMNDTSVGEILAVLSWFMVIILFSFEKALLAIELQKEGHFWLQMCGASTQIGSALGAFLSLILVAVLNLFKSKQIMC